MNEVATIYLFYHYQHVSQSGSCCVKPIAVLHLIVDGCTLHVDYMYRTTTTIDDWIELSESNVTTLL